MIIRCIARRNMPAQAERLRAAGLLRGDWLGEYSLTVGMDYAAHAIMFYRGNAFYWVFTDASPDELVMTPVHLFSALTADIPPGWKYRTNGEFFDVYDSVYESQSIHRDLQG